MPQKASRPPLTLDYATPQATRLRDPAVWPSLPAYGWSIGFQALLAATDTKWTPGGPFISIHGEIIPILISLFVVGFGVRSLFAGPPLRHVVVTMFMSMSLAVAVFTITNMVFYWRAPFSRGDLIGL